MTQPTWKEIQLDKGFVAIVDEADYATLSQYTWYVHEPKSTKAKYARTTIYSPNTKKGRNVAMHRMILTPPKGMDVDHLDGDGLNNTRANIRIATRSENQRNQYKHRNGIPVGIYKSRDKYAVKHYVGEAKDLETAIAMHRGFMQKLDGTVFRALLEQIESEIEGKKETCDICANQEAHETKFNKGIDTALSILRRYK